MRGVAARKYAAAMPRSSGIPRLVHWGLGVGLAVLAACAGAEPSPAKRDSDSSAGITGMTQQPPAKSADTTRDAGTFGAAGRPAAPPARTPISEPDACASAELKLTRVIPTVWLMIDGSGSMGAPLQDLTGPSRWQVTRDALIGASGLVPRLQTAVEFGLYVYDGGLSPPGIPGPQCPATVIVEPALDNASAVSGTYPEVETGASTPTHFALLDLKSRIDAAGAVSSGGTFIVLATDGMPNLCDFHDGLPSTPDTEAEAVQTVQQLASAGTQVFVISLAGDDPILQAHLEQVASAGGTGKPPFTPTTQDELAAALSEIVGATASCDVRLHGRVENNRECMGTVTLDGKPLVCDDDDGYRVKDDHQAIELLGHACEALQSAADPELKVTFPCGDVTVL